MRSTKEGFEPVPAYRLQSEMRIATTPGNRHWVRFEFRFLYAPRFFGGATRLRARRSFLLHGLLYRIARAFNALLGYVALPESYWRYFFKNASTRR